MADKITQEPQVPTTEEPTTDAPTTYAPTIHISNDFDDEGTPPRERLRRRAHRA